MALTPSKECPLCPRLVLFRDEISVQEPTWFNAPVPSFGDIRGRLLIVGLAPGLRGANRTGRPFTGDYAGVLLYQTLLKYGFATGVYEERIDDSLELVDCCIANSVRCVPPQNKPTPQEITTCRPFLQSHIESMLNLRCVLVLGRIAHESAVRAFGGRLADYPFSHGGEALLRSPLKQQVTLLQSYHCSRYNTNTGRLTQEMFEAVLARARELLL